MNQYDLNIPPWPTEGPRPSALPPETTDPIPQEWKDKGYIGQRFAVRLEDRVSGALPSVEQIDALKKHVPYECTPGVWLALAVEYIGRDPYVILVAKA